VVLSRSCPSSPTSDSSSQDSQARPTNHPSQDLQYIHSYFRPVSATMDSTTPIPVATYGKDPKIAESVREKLLPDIEVVHACLDPAIALTELPAVFSGNLETVPASGLGTNASAPADKRKVPQAVFFGGGFSDEEFEKIKAAVLAANPTAHFIKVQKRDVLAAGSFGPNPDTIAKIFRKRLAAAMVAA